MILQTSFVTQESYMFVFGVLFCGGFVTAPPDPPLLIPYELKPAGLVLVVCVLGVVTALARPLPYMQGTNKYRFEEALQRLCNVPDAMLAQ